MPLSATSKVGQASRLSGAGETPALLSDDSARTGAIDLLADPAAPDLEAMGDAEWEHHAMSVATERVKRQVKAEQFQMFDLYVLQGWPVRDVARVLGVSAGQVYLAKHRVGRLLKKQLKQLAQGR